jgi:SAM-dependent methyltransferase
MRRVTEQLATDPSSWTAEQARQVAAAFDALAAGWEQQTRGGRHAPLLDALDRGASDGPVSGRVCLEVGSGTGLVTPTLVARFGLVVCVDPAWEMVRRAPADVGHRLLADGAHLPLPGGSVDVAVLVNAFLFPTELDRVLRADGSIVWVNSRGPATPIHLSAERVVGALPGRWRATASTAGAGTWAVLRRA